jgi:hypothetical protein
MGWRERESHFSMGRSVMLHRLGAEARAASPREVETCGLLPRLSEKPKCWDFGEFTYSKINSLRVQKNPI